MSENLSPSSKSVRQILERIACILKETIGEKHQLYIIGSIGSDKGVPYESDLDIVVVNKGKNSQNIKQIIENLDTPIEINHIDFRSFKEEDKALNFIRENCHHGNYEKFFDYYGDRYIPVEKI